MADTMEYKTAFGTEGASPRLISASELQEKLRALALQMLRAPELELSHR